MTFSSPDAAPEPLVDPAITPDDKDWTWTLRERCPDCGFLATDVAPAFPSLRTRSEDELRAFLVAPHPPMPNFNLPREQIEDLVAYIRSIPAN